MHDVSSVTLHSEQKKSRKGVVGRPSKYKPEYCERVIADMAKGLSLAAFAGGIPVSKDTVQEWVKVHPEFSVSVKKGQAARLRFLEVGLMAGGPRTVAMIFALKNAAPDEWREKSEVAATVTIPGLKEDDLSRAQAALIHMAKPK